MASSYTLTYIGCKAKRQRVQWDGSANALDWLRVCGTAAQLQEQHNFRRTQLLPFMEESISSLGTAVQHKFRRTQLLPSREESISSLGTAVQHNFRRVLLVPSREESISSLGAARYSISSGAHNYCHLGRKV